MTTTSYTPPGTPRIVPLLASLEGAPLGWKWHAQQRELVERIANSPAKVILLQAEPGIGKTVIAWACAKVAEQTAYVLVHTRQLERQYLRDFTDLRMMEGRAHFTCNLTKKGGEYAPCTVGVRCQLKMGGCSYYDEKRRAAATQISVHNYAYWLGETSGMRPLFGSADLIICDEAHAIQSVLMDAETVEFDRGEVRQLGLTPIPATLPLTVAWAQASLARISAALTDAITRAKNDGLPIAMESYEEELDEELDQYGMETDFQPTEGQQDLIAEIRELGRMADRLHRVATIDPASDGIEWIVDRETDTRKVLVEPLYGKRGFARILRAARSKVILMSAYLAPKMLVQNLGIEEGTYEIIEAAPAYDRKLSPVLFCPVLSLSHRTSTMEWNIVVKVIDALVDHFAQGSGTGSGLIHVPSVALRNTILGMSRHKDKIIWYDGMGRDRNPNARTKDEALAEFTQRGVREQVILLGQSISTGVDIPYVPQFNIIVKMPFPPIQTPMMKARMQVDKLYYPFLTICELVQAVGRGKRAVDHHSTSIILDLGFEWFRNANKQHFPLWFTRYLNRDGWKALPDVKLSLRKRGVVIP